MINQFRSIFTLNQIDRLRKFTFRAFSTEIFRAIYCCWLQSYFGFIVFGSKRYAKTHSKLNNELIRKFFDFLFKIKTDTYPPFFVMSNISNLQIIASTIDRQRSLGQTVVLPLESRFTFPASHYVKN